MTLSYHDTANIFLGKADLSQRGYKELRTKLAENNVVLPICDKLQYYRKNMKVGVITEVLYSPDCDCMGVTTKLWYTLQQIVCTKDLFKLFTFPIYDQQVKR